MSRDSSFLMAWFYRQVNHGSLFLRPWLRLYTGDTAVPLLSNSNSTNTNPNGSEANAAGRSENARMQRKQSKCGMIQEGEGHWPNSSKKMQKARYLWVLRRANKEARDMRNTRSTRQWSKCTFQRARRLLFCPWAMRSFDGTGTPSPSAEWQWIEKPPPKNKNKTCKRAACGLADPPYHRAKPINLLSNAPVDTRGRPPAFFETLLSISISASHAVPVAIPDLFVITTVPVSSPPQPLLRLCPIHSPNSDPRLHGDVFRKSVRYVSF
jgi:hypothetical protein